MAAVRPACPQTLLESVGDREADIYELFAWAQAAPGTPKLLVRATQNRCVAGGQGHLRAQVQEVGAPPGVEPIEWMLLTTVPVTTAEPALERLCW